MRNQARRAYRKSKRKTAFSTAEIPPDFELTEEFSKTFDRMEHTARHIYITGNAGTGKSTLLQYFKKNTKKNIVVLAPTGVAAIHVGGATIHSLFQFPPRVIQREEVVVLRRKSHLFHALDAVVIDEVSMVRADLMEWVDYSLRINRGNSREPFGGVQMILFGDLFQLPPVVETGLRGYFDEIFKSPYFFDAEVIRKLREQGALEIIVLERIFRQSDPGFKVLLNKVRYKEANDEDLKQINQRCKESGEGGRDVAVTLTTTNELASQINFSRLENLPTREYFYEATVTGNFDERAFPTDPSLKLKEGAQVMMIRNDPDKNWVNGSLGVVKQLSPEAIKVAIEGGGLCFVDRVTWEKVDYALTRETGEIEPVVTGTFQQYPIKLAWAITIHKSQGKTFNKVVIDVGHGAFAHGQVYVALSRCKTLEGIRLRRPIRQGDIILDRKVKEFLTERATEKTFPRLQTTGPIKSIPINPGQAGMMGKKDGSDISDPADTSDMTLPLPPLNSGRIDIREVIKSQYHASLEMLKQAIEKCPESLWADPEPKNKFWHIAFHALFYTHFYLQNTEKDFRPWAKHRDFYNFMGPLPWPPHEVPKIGEPYSKGEVLEYLEFCQKEVEKRVPGLNLDGESGFPWKPYKKLDLQIESIRHIQHHAGQLMDRLKAKHGIGVDWVGSA